MPGFTVNRFLDVTDLKELTCLVCRHVLCKPLITSCCRQAFCESCIKPYLDIKRSCPLDRKPLNIEGLGQPPATLTTKLSLLKMKCVFAINGCPEVVTPESVEQHEKACAYGSNLCQQCSFAMIGDHICQKAVADYKANVSKELEDANAVLRNLRVQLDNYNRTIRELTLDRARSIDPSLANKPLGPRVNTNKDLLAEARKYVNSAIVDGHKTPREIVAMVVDLAREAVVTKGDKIYEVARFIKEVMDSHYMGDWNVYLLWNNLGFVFHNVSSDAFVEIKFGKVSLVVYKSFDSLSFNRMAALFKSGAILNFVVTKTGFDEARTREIEKLVLATLKSSVDTIEFTDKVTSNLMAQWGGVWHAFVMKSGFGHYCVRSDKGRFCLLTNSDVKILIFQ